MRGIPGLFYDLSKLDA